MIVKRTALAALFYVLAWLNLTIMTKDPARSLGVICMIYIGTLLTPRT